MALVFYLRGLNTYGDDFLHFGPLVMGEMHGPLQRQAAELGILLHPVKNMGSGSFAETVTRAKASLLASAEWRQADKVHLLGHSMGALVARALVHDREVQEKVCSLTSYGTPHHGTMAAETLLKMRAKRRRVFKWVGWGDVDEKAHMFEHLTPQAMQTFNVKFADLNHLRYASAICRTDFNQLSTPMKAMAVLSGHHRQELRRGKKSDGLITTESQKHGVILGEFTLDHISEIGYFFHAAKKTRGIHQGEFKRLVQTFSDFWAQFD